MRRSCQRAASGSGDPAVLGEMQLTARAQHAVHLAGRGFDVGDAGKNLIGVEAHRISVTCPRGLRPSGRRAVIPL